MKRLGFRLPAFDARRRLGLAVAGAAAVAGAGLGWWRWQAEASQPPALTADTLWDLSFATPQQATLRLADFRGSPLLLNFWATWCAPCVQEMPLLDAFWREHSAQGVQVLGLAIDQPVAVRRFLEQRPVAYPVAVAGLAGIDTARALGNSAGGLPYSVWLGADGRPRAHKMGLLSRADLTAWSKLG